MTNQELGAFIKKNPIGVTCGALCLAVGLAMYFRSDLFPAAETTLADKSAEGERHASNVKNAAQLKEQFDALVAANKEIDSRIVRVKEFGANTQFFYKLESETGVKFTDFRQNPQPSNVASKTKSTYTPVSFSVTATGDMAQLLRFLRTLESGAHYARVMSATLNVNSNSRSAPLTLALNLELLGSP